MLFLWFLNAAHLVINEAHGLYESVLIFPKFGKNVAIYEHMLRFVFLCFGFSGSETTASSGWQICSCWGIFVESREASVIEPKAAASWR